MNTALNEVYVYKGFLSDLPYEVNEYTVSCGNPLIGEHYVAHFRSKNDLIAYLHGDWPHLNYQDVKDRFKLLYKMVEKSKAAAAPIECLLDAKICGVVAL